MSQTPPAAPGSAVAARALPRHRRVLPGLVGLTGLALGLGALAGAVWRAIVPLPVYRVAADGAAATSERGLAQVVAADAWFCALGLVVGVLLGLVAWRRFRDLGWLVVLLAVGAAVAAALLCWGVGAALGPRHFAARLAAAAPGDAVPVSLALRAKAALLLWPFAAVVPVLLASSLGRDDEDPAARPPGEEVAVSGSSSPGPTGAPAGSTGRPPGR